MSWDNCVYIYIHDISVLIQSEFVHKGVHIYLNSIASNFNLIYKQRKAKIW